MYGDVLSRQSWGYFLGIQSLETGEYVLVTLDQGKSDSVNISTCDDDIYALLLGILVMGCGRWQQQFVFKQHY